MSLICHKNLFIKVVLEDVAALLRRSTLQYVTKYKEFYQELFL